MTDTITNSLVDNSGKIYNSGYRKFKTMKISTFLVTENAKNTRILTVLVEKLTRIVNILDRKSAILPAITISHQTS